MNYPGINKTTFSINFSDDFFVTRKIEKKVIKLFKKLGFKLYRQFCKNSEIVMSFIKEK